jgi:hypothetical protein
VVFTISVAAAALAAKTHRSTMAPTTGMTSRLRQASREGAAFIVCLQSVFGRFAETGISRQVGQGAKPQPAAIRPEGELRTQVFRPGGRECVASRLATTFLVSG